MDRETFIFFQINETTAILHHLTAINTLTVLVKEIFWFALWWNLHIARRRACLCHYQYLARDKQPSNPRNISGGSHGPPSKSNTVDTPIQTGIITGKSSAPMLWTRVTDRGLRSLECHGPRLSTELQAHPSGIAWEINGKVESSVTLPVHHGIL